MYRIALVLKSARCEGRVKNSLLLFFVSLLSLYARGRRKIAVALFFLSMLATGATAAALVMWGVGGALYGQLAELLGPGRYVVFGGSFSDADLLAAVQAVCSPGGYGVVYRPVKVRYVNGSVATFTAAFVPRGLMRGIEVLDAVALRHVAAAGDVVDVEVGGRWYQVRIAEVRDFTVFVPGLAADLYLDAELLGPARYDVLVVEKGNCGGARELEALFPRAQVFDADLVLTGVWSQLLAYLGATALVSASSIATAASLTYTAAALTLAASYKEFAVLRLLGLKRRSLVALMAALFLTPSAAGALVVLLASLSVEDVLGVSVRLYTAASAALVTAASALSLAPTLRKLYSLTPLEAIRAE